MKKNEFQLELVTDNHQKKVFRTQCRCNDKDHSLWIEVYYDREEEDVSMLFYYNMPISFKLQYKGFLERTWERLKVATKVIFNKPVYFEEAFIFRNQTHVKEFSDIIYIIAREVKKETSHNEQLQMEINRLKEKLTQYERRK